MQVDIQNEEQTEALLASISTAPRVTLDQVNQVMKEVEYWVEVPTGTTTTIASAFIRGFHLADGHSYCVNPENFNAEYGEKSAIAKAEANAKDAVWKMLGTLLFAHNNSDLFKEQSND